MTPATERNRVIPMAAWVIAGLFIALPLGIVLVAVRHADFLPLGFVFIVGAPIMAGYTLLVGYIYNDARRRRMRYVMWTLLAIFLTNGIGIILYFILRDPLPEYCSACGSLMHSGYAYCPRCGSSMLPACANCRRANQPGWSHCAYCGTKL